MSTSKHINKICIAAMAVVLVLTVFLMSINTSRITASAKTMKYESTLFDNSYVHQIDIVMNDWDSFIETCESEEYTSCNVVIDGNSYKNIAIRAKGNTSLSNVSSMGSQRYSFKLEFDHYTDGNSYDGLDKLCLNNLIQDNTMMKDYIAYTMMKDFDVDSPLCSFVYITVNGEDWGLYLAVEGVEDSFLARNYGSDTGELYKPDSISFGGGRGNGKGFNMDDFDFGTEDSDSGDQGDEESDTKQSGNSFPQMAQGGQFPQGENNNFPQGGNNSFPQGGNFEMPEGGKAELPEGFSFDNIMGGGFGGMGSDDVKLKYIDDDPDSYSNIFDNAKTDVTNADKKRLIASLKNLSEYTDLENTLDTEEVLRYFVVHSFLVNGDSYTGSMIHNYYLHEKDGQLGMIPWDYNLAFGTFQGGNADSAVNDSIDEVLSDRPMQAWIFSDESYTNQYHELYAEFIEKWFSNGELEALIADTAEMLRTYVEKDPTKFCTTEEFDTGVETMQQFVKLRAEAVSRQLEGDTTAVETGDINLSDMGSMGGGMGGNMPNMPQGGDTSQSGNMPNFTQGGDTQSMPNMPQGGDTQNMPNFTQGGDAQSMPNMPQGGDAQNMPNMPQGGDAQNMPNMPQGGDAQSMPNMPQGGDTSQGGDSSSQTESAGESKSMPSFSKEQPDNFPSSGVVSGGSDITKWILVGISVAILAAGLLIAVLKKRTF